MYNAKDYGPVMCALTFYSHVEITCINASFL